MKKLKHRYILWKDWKKYNNFGWLYKLFVLLGWTRSPTFESWVIYDFGDKNKK